MKPTILGIGIVTAVLIASPAGALANVYDDFSDLNDTVNPAWVHLDGLVGSTGQSWDASGGNYRMQAPNNGFSGYGFVGSYVPASFTDSITRADFVNFAGPGANPVFGVATRLNGNNGFNALTGYAWAYEPFAAGLTGELVLYRITGASLTDLGSVQVSLDPSKDYTFELAAIGSELRGRVFEVGGGLVAEKTATDAAFASGYSGVLGYGQNGVTPPSDFTVDNFAVVPEPASSLLLGLGLAGLWVIRRRQ